MVCPNCKCVNPEHTRQCLYCGHVVSSFQNAPYHSDYYGQRAINQRPYYVNGRGTEYTGYHTYKITDRYVSRDIYNDNYNNMYYRNTNDYIALDTKLESYKDRITNFLLVMAAFDISFMILILEILWFLI